LVELNLSQNGIGTAGKERLRSSWRGPASGLEWTGTWGPFGSDSSDDEDEDEEDEMDEDEDGKFDEHDFGDSRVCGGGGGGRGM
jgi:hypothetical protein